MGFRHSTKQNNQNPRYPTGPAPGGGNYVHHKSKSGYPTKPAPQTGGKRSVLSRMAERFKEKPITPEELTSLKMKAQKETYKTQIQNAKNRRGSRFSGFSGGGGGGSGRRSSRQDNSGSFLLGGGSSNGSFLTGEGQSGPSLDFITGNNSTPRGRGKPQRSGLEDMFT